MSGGVRVPAAARLLDLTRRIRAGVEGDDWEAAATLEAERRALLEAIFDGPPSAEELPALTATLREVVRANDELVGLAEHRRRALEREVDTAAAGRRAVGAYAATAGGG